MGHRRARAQTGDAKPRALNCCWPREPEPDAHDDEHERDARRGGDAVERERLERGGRNVRHEKEERPRAGWEKGEQGRGTKRKRTK